MEEKVKLTYLCDFYGELLKEHQRRIFEAYLFEDLSMSEIAQREGMTRQGVHDHIRRCEKKLLDYEEKLRLYEKFLLVKDRAERARMMTCKPELLQLLTEIVEAF